MARKESALVCTECGSGYIAQRSDSIRCPACRVSNGVVRSRRYELAKQSPCPDCGGAKGRKAKRCHDCDNRSRAGTHTGADNHQWKGGRHLRKHDGYWEVLVDGQRILEHRYLWEQANGPLPKKWVVHHLNGVKDDNRLENLVGMARSHHGPRAHIDPSAYEARIRALEARIRELEK